MARVYKLYEERLHTNNALDFDDLLIKTVRLLRDVAEVRDRYNERFRYLLVDEYQDTNRPQYELMRLLSSLQNRVFVATALLAVIPLVAARQRVRQHPDGECGDAEGRRVREFRRRRMAG